MPSSGNILFEPVFDAALRTLCYASFTPWLLCVAEGLDLTPAMRKHVKSGRIIFDVSGSAIKSLTKSDDALFLDMRDSAGLVRMMRIPYENVIALVAKEDPINQIKFTYPKRSPVIDVQPVSNLPLEGNVVKLFK